MKQKWIVISLSFITVLLAIGVNAVIFLIKSPSYTAVIGKNWGIALPDEAYFTEIYEQDSGASFHGDGIRYHIFEYEQEEFVTGMLEWKTVEDKTSYHESYSVAADEWFSEISVEKSYYPDYDNCLYWYKAQEDNSEIIIFWDRKANLLYVLEHFL